jgi:hypothetical protein
MTVRRNPGTEPSMAKVGWTVQTAFYDRNSHATRESSPSLCREAAQSDERSGVDTGWASLFAFWRPWPGATRRECWVPPFGRHT